MLSTTRVRPRYICVNCQRRYAQGRASCLCGAIHTVQPIANGARSSGLSGDGSRAVRADELSDTPIARIPIREPWHEIMGGGWPHESQPQLLLYGGPATRKTTEALQLADELGPTLYISTEASTERLKSYITRLGLRADRIWLLKELELALIMRELRGNLETFKTIVLDSLTAVRDRGRRGDPLANLQKVERLIGNRSLIIVGQVNKDGTMAGSNEVPHKVDTASRLTKTTIDTWKNRFGPETKIKRPTATAIRARARRPARLRSV